MNALDNFHNYELFLWMHDTADPTRVVKFPTFSLSSEMGLIDAAARKFSREVRFRDGCVFLDRPYKL